MRRRPHLLARARQARWCAVLVLLAGLLTLAPLRATSAHADPTGRPTPLPTASDSTFTGRPGPAPLPTGTGPAAARGTVVLLGVPGLRWSDVNRTTTPTLWRLANDGPVGTVSVRSVLTPTCAVDAWLVLGAGRAISDAAQTPACPEPAEPVGGRVPDWDRYRRQAAAEEGSPVPGTLGAQLRAGQRRVVAVGPGAAIATATPDGSLAGDYLSTRNGIVPAVRGALERTPDLLVADLGRIWITRERMTRADQVRQVEEQAAQILPLLPATATIVLTGTASSDADPRLGLISLTGFDADGKRYRAGALGSGSSRQAGLIRGPDVTATLLQLLGLPVPPAVDGAPVRIVGQEGASSEEILHDVADRELATNAVNPLSRWFVGGLILASAGVGALAWWTLRRRRAHVLAAADDDAAHRSTAAARVAREQELRSLAALRYVALTLAALPVVTFVAALIPWWRSTLPGLALTPILVALAVAVMSIALAEPWRSRTVGPAGALAGLTAGVIAVDTATGSGLQVNALLGGGQEASGRIDGMSDLGFALFLTGALVLGICIAEWFWATGRGRRAAAPVLALGLVCGLVVALPPLGNTVSGLITLVPGFLLLAFVAVGGRFSVRNIALVATATLVLAGALAAVDLQREASRRTRLGRFLAGLADGSAGDVLARKLQAVQRATVGDLLTLMVPLAVAVLLLVLVRRSPGGTTNPVRELSGARHVVTRGSIVVAVTLVLGALANDSGGAVAGMGLLLGLPLLIAAVAQHRLEAAHALGTSPLRPRGELAAPEAPGARPVQRPAPTWADAARERRVPPVG